MARRLGHDAELARYVTPEVLNEDGEEAKAIKAEVHRTMLWRFVTGRRSPDADTIAKLHRLSGGRVPADGWGAEENEAPPRSGTDG